MLSGTFAVIFLFGNIFFVATWLMVESSSEIPSWDLALVATTGIPKSRDSVLISTSIPWR